MNDESSEKTPLRAVGLGDDSMVRRIGRGVILLGSLFIGSQAGATQPDVRPETIRGELLSIKGDMYLIRDIFGKFVYLRLDHSAKQDAMLVPGKKIEADVIPGQIALAIRLVK